MASDSVSAAAAVGEAVAAAHREEWPAVLATVVRITRDFDLAEECVQDAYAQALTAWAQHGIPASPGAWLTTTAKNRALDLLRHEAVRNRALPLLVIEADTLRRDDADTETQAVADDRLRLIFTCCHPALSPEAQAALTLRLVCGLTTPEIARVFLVSESTMAARITRAKKKIATARIPYRVPDESELASRAAVVLDVVNLLFTVGHTAPSGPTLHRSDLTARAVELGRMLHTLLPRNNEVTGILAMMLLTIARSRERAWPNGELKLLAEQDRGKWNHHLIREGTALVTTALMGAASQGAPPGKYALLAVINALHDEAPTAASTDWQQIVGVYDALLRVWPTPVVELNRAAAISFATGPHAGLDAIDAIDDTTQLARYPYFHAARADCLTQLGRHDEARAAFHAALQRTENAAERRFLQARRDSVGS